MLLARGFVLFGCLAMGVAVAGCGTRLNSDALLLVGDWHLIESVELEQRISSGSGEDRSEKSESQSEPRMILSFRTDGTLQTRSRIGEIDSTKLGTWRLLKIEPDKRKLAIECQLHGQTTTHDIELVDTHTILLIPPNLAGLSNKLTFRRTE